MSEVTLLNPSQIEAALASSPTRGGRFPWENRPVGAGFSVPREGYSPNSRPSLPPRLVEMGIRYSVTTAIVAGVESYVMRRLA